MTENQSKPDGAETQDSRKANLYWWLVLSVYVVVGALLGMALSTAIALMYAPISSLPDRRFEVPGLGGPPGVMIGLTIFLFTRKP